MNVVIGIDPGPTQSAILFLHDDERIACDIMSNEEMLDVLGPGGVKREKYAIEVVESFGMPVGREVFQTCEFIGRLRQRLGREFDLRLGRKDVKRYLCGSLRAKDSNVRAALIDLYGGSRQAACGTKKNPGPLYRVTSHCWSALAVAVTARDILETPPHASSEERFVRFNKPRGI